MADPKQARSYMPAAFIAVAALPVPARGIGLSIETAPGIVSLKAHADSADTFAAQLSETLGIKPPQAPGALSYGRQRALLQIAPHEWWLLTDRPDAAKLSATLAADSAERASQVLDISGGCTGIWVDGIERMTVLRHLTAFDLEAMPSQSGAGIVMAQCHVRLVRPGIDRLLILAPRSLASWLTRQLADAGRAYGVIEHGELQVIAPQRQPL